MQQKELKNKYIDKQQYIIEHRNKDVRAIGITDYAGKPFLEMDFAERKMSELIKDDEPFLIGRIGETEMRTISEYRSGLWFKRSCRIASHCICNNAGFFPNNPFAINKFCKKYYVSMLNIDYLALFAWNNEEKFMECSNELKGSFLSRVVGVLHCDYKWTSALKGKKVLVISPFEKSIQKQFARKTFIFGENSNILPDFELITLKAVQSIGGKGADGFSDWFDALEYMEKKIDVIDFDVALIGCGAYGIPLGSYIKNSGRQAIVVGGYLQLMFGIIGKRWEDDPIVKEYVNEYWVRPSEEEKPTLFGKVEDGCYW